MNLLDTKIEALKFRFSGRWFDAAGVDNFLQYGSFRFKFVGQLDLGVRYNPMNFRKVLQSLTGAGIFIRRRSLKHGLESNGRQSFRLSKISDKRL